MSSLNYRVRAPRVTNHHGLPVRAPLPEQKLVRMTLANMLFEDTFYIDGQSTYDILKETVHKVKPEFVAELAKKARTQYKLRHVPLALMRELARSSKLKAEDLAEVIQRPDEMAEFLAIYWKEGRQPISNQVKRGLAAAFTKFDEYALAKWDKNSAAISLRDVMFMTHPKPTTPEQEALFKRVANQELKTPDTWEVALSGGADKKETFERLMRERKLGALAFLRNLRNMVNAGVDSKLLSDYCAGMNAERVLPFRFISAARVMPQLEHILEPKMLESIASHEKLPGKTLLLIDVSGSMFGARVSEKSDLRAFDAAAALAILCREICEEVDIFSFSDKAVRVPARRGFALGDAIRDSQWHCGTWLGNSLEQAANLTDRNYNRIIVFTDEQSSDEPKNYGVHSYLVNVANYQHGLNIGNWVTISGFSEAVIDFIQAYEKEV